MKFTVLSVALRGVAHLLKNESVSKWAQKVLLTGIAPTPQESHSSEEEVMGLRAEDVNLSHLGTQRASYSPKGIYTEALLVTHDNIGKLALELETELRYVQGRPYLVIDVYRGEYEDAGDTRLELHPGFWIVVLRNEIHLFLAHQFESTFEIETFESKDLQEELPLGEPEFVDKGVQTETPVRGDIFKTNEPGSWLTQSGR